MDSPPRNERARPGDGIVLSSNEGRAGGERKTEVEGRGEKKYAATAVVIATTDRQARAEARAKATATSRASEREQENEMEGGKG